MRRSRSSCAGFGFRVCSRGADVGSVRFQCMKSHRTCLRVSVSQWSRYKRVCGLRFRRAQFGRRWHLSVSACPVYGMYHLQRAQSRRRVWAGFAGVVHAVRACVGGLISFVWVDFKFEQMYFAAQMCVRSRCKSGKIRLRRTVPLQIQRTRLGE